MFFDPSLTFVVVMLPEKSFCTFETELKRCGYCEDEGSVPVPATVFL